MADATPTEADLAPYEEATLRVEESKARVELSGEQLNALMSPIHNQRVASRQQGGKNLSYVEAWDIKATLIRLFGFGGFSAEVVDSKILDIRDDGRQGNKQDGTLRTPYVMAYAQVRLTIFGIGPQGQDAVYTEAAIGTNDGSIIGDVADNALKSAASDALKRCAIYLGTQFGLGLYDSGKRDEVVKVLLNPEQKELLAAFRANGPEAQARQQQADAAAAALARAAGAKPVQEVGDGSTPVDPRDLVRQAAAGEESQA